MFTYNQLIEGYESPEHSDEENMLIDYCNSAITRSESVKRLPPPPRLNPEDFRPKSSQLSFTVGSKRDYNFRGKKPYTFLSAVEMEHFEHDLKQGTLSKEELCQKYKVSISTTARFIRNFKAYGKLSIKKGELGKGTTDLISRLKNQYPQLTVAQIQRKIQEMTKSMGIQKHK